MSVTVWKLAGALHKGMDQVLYDLQQQNVSVEKYYDEVSDAEMVKLAEQYGRREHISQLISNEYISELAKKWDEENLVKLLPAMPAENRFLNPKLAERYSILDQYTHRKKEKILSEPIVTKNPKVMKGILLIGKEEKAIQVIKDKRDLQVFLIPQNKKEEETCYIWFGGKSVLGVKINRKNCMLLIWDNGRYFYEPAEFTKIAAEYHLDLEKYLTDREIELPIYAHKNLHKKGIWYMTKKVQPEKSGFALQDYLKCSVNIDKDKLCICDGTVNRIWWETEENIMTIKGRASVRGAVNHLLSKVGEMNYKGFLEEIDFMERTFESCAERYNYYYRMWGMQESIIQVPKLHIENLQKIVDKKSEILAEEALERLKILESQGLSKRIIEKFAKDRTIYLNYNGDKLRPIHDYKMERKIKYFEKENHAIAYLATVTYSQFGELLNIFYVSKEPKQWEMEREYLKEKNPIVYVVNLNDDRLSEFGSIRYEIKNGDIKRTA